MFRRETDVHWLSELWLRVIAAFKLVKATLLLSSGIAAIGLLRPEFAREVSRWAMDLAADRHYHALDVLLVHLVNVDDRTLRMVIVGSFAYAVLFFTEGFGLFYDKRWAEYLTIVTTAGLIPFEVFEILRHATPVKVEVLVGNLAIVGYLAWRVTRKPQEAEAAARVHAVG
jgi:uncharacterized membrane protein (DUF2068 family)